MWLGWLAASSLVTPQQALGRRVAPARASAGGVGFGQQNAGAPYSFRRSAAGERFEVRPGDHWPIDVRDDGGHTERERSESVGAPLAPGEVMTASFRMEVADGAPTRSPWTILAQIHQNDFAGQKTYTVPFAFGLEAGDRPFVRATANPNNSFESFHNVVLWKSDQPFVRGRFHDVAIALRIDVGESGQGFLKVWFDGASIVDYSGPIGIAGTSGYYWKYGIYRQAADEVTITTVKDACFGGAECQPTPAAGK